MDIHKSKRRNNLIIILCVIVLVSIYVTIERREVIVLNKQWQMISNTCEVSFDIKNNKSDQLWTNITIKAQSQQKTQNGKTKNQLVGEKSLAIVLKPKETKKIIALVPVSAAPDRITIKTWKPE